MASRCCGNTTSGRKVDTIAGKLNLMATGTLAAMGSVMRSPQRPIRLLCLLTLVFASLTGCAPPALFENECGHLVHAVATDAVIPQGMRRTRNGWEDSSLWHLPTTVKDQSINSLIAKQQEREPVWVRSVFAKVRATPPLMLALIQITAIAAIVHINRGKKPGQAV